MAICNNLFNIQYINCLTSVILLLYIILLFYTFYIIVLTIINSECVYMYEELCVISTLFSNYRLRKYSE